MRRAGKRLAALIGAVTVAPLGLVATVPRVDAAAPSRSWEPSVTPLSAGRQNAYNPVVVVGGDNVVTAVWERAGKVQARQQRDGVWQPPVTLGRGEMPHVDADDEGNVTVVWTTPRLDIVSRRKPHNGDWRPTFLLQPRDGVTGRAMDPALDVSPTGHALVTWDWDSYDSKPRGFQARVRAASPGGEWGKITNLTGWRADEVWAYPVVGGRGWGAVVLSEYPWVRLVRHGPGEGWSTPQRLGPWNGYAVAMSPGGAMSVVWSDNHGVYGRYADPDGAFETKTRLSTEGTGDSIPHVALDATGTALAAWWDDASKRVGTAEHLRSGSWSAPTLLHEIPVEGEVEINGMQLRMNSSGDAAVAANFAPSSNPTEGQAWAMLRPTAAEWTSPERITLAGSYSGIWDLRMAIGPDGNAVAVWTNTVAGYRRVMFSAHFA